HFGKQASHHRVIFLQYPRPTNRRHSTPLQIPNSCCKREDAMTAQPSYIPQGFHSVTAYLVGGGTARLIDFLKDAFGAEETFKMQREDGTIAHASVSLAASALEMADPMKGAHAMSPSLHLYVPDADATYRRAIEAGATFIYEPKDMPY